MIDYDDDGEPVGPPRKKHKKRFGIVIEHAGWAGRKNYFFPLWYEKERSRDEAYATTLKRIANGPDWFRKWHKSVEKIER
jgi:hypothetical protein